MNSLNEYMLIFRYEPTNEEPTKEQLEEMEKSWGNFIEHVAMQGKLVSTHQLGFDGKIISADKSLSDGFYISEGQTLGGNMVLKAESIDDAVVMAEKCPILFMGGTVEIRNIVPM